MLRKLRFPILIGSCALAAGVLFYFSNARTSSDKTQGAIGKREVYRDAQVNSADVATPGTAPVATQAILESSEFKELAKNPAFVSALQDGSLALVMRSSVFTNALMRSSTQEMSRTALTEAMKSDSHIAYLADNMALTRLFSTQLFRSVASNMEFRSSLLSGAMQGALANGLDTKKCCFH